MCADAVEEVTVVAYDEYRVLELAEVLLQPLYGVEVEVVGRLVEQQVVGIAEESFGEHHAHFLLTRELAHQLIVLRLLDAKAGE